MLLQSLFVPEKRFTLGRGIPLEMEIHIYKRGNGCGTPYGIPVHCIFATCSECNMLKRESVLTEMAPPMNMMSSPLFINSPTAVSPSKRLGSSGDRCFFVPTISFHAFFSCNGRIWHPV
uniref:Uncharacterized protein n=1 Tax=Physcomitrium patens TaxID=3218 RepID=A0A2K1KP30_PHYPA|nr:hypothetical protein PHYPA_006427 [Physcomitrium patens]